MISEKEVILNGISFNDTIYDFELLFDEFYNRDCRTMSGLEDYAKYFKEENDMLKSDITTLSKANESLVKRDTANNFKIKDLESDIENYKSYLTTWNNANNGLLKYNDELKAEIKQLKARLHANDVKADFHAYCEMREYNDDLIVKNGFLRQENEELRATISKMETTTINEDDLK